MQRNSVGMGKCWMAVTAVGGILAGAEAQAAFIPPDSDNLQLWLKADAGVLAPSGNPAANSGTVQIWQDQSGKSVNLANGVSGKRPIYYTSVGPTQSAALYFDGVDDYLGITSGSGTLSAAIKTAFIVILPSATINTASSRQVPLSIGYTGTGNVTAQFPFALGATTDSIDNELVTTVSNISGSNSTQSAYVSAGGSIGTAQWTSLSTEYSASTGYYQLSINGASVAATNSGQTDSDGGFAAGRVFLGNSLTSSSGSRNDYFGGYIAEVLLYSTVLSADGRQAVENYIAEKYSIPEPASTGLLATGGVLLLRRRQRQQGR